MIIDNRIDTELFSLYAELDLSTLLDRVAEKIKALLGCEEAAIFLYNVRKEELYFEIATGEKGKTLKQIVLQKGEGVAGWVAEFRQALIIHDCLQDHRFSTRSDHQSSFQTRSIIAFPVISNGNLLGVLEGINKIGSDFSPKDLKTIEVITHYVSIPLQNALLFQQLNSESAEKDLLLSLAREIAVALRFEDLYPTLVELIRSHSDPSLITVSINRASDRPQRSTLLNKKTDEGSRISARFNFLSAKGLRGTLEITTRHHLTDESLAFFKGLADFLALMADKLEMQQDRIHHEKTERELEIARTIQQSFLISSAPASQMLDCCFINIPSSKVGGDYYDLFALPTGKMLFTVADIAGHGIPASLLMSIFRANFCYHARRDTSLEETLNRINNLIAETTDPSQYLTAFFGCFDPVSMTLTYINAGHPAPLLLRDSQRRLLHSNNLTVGMFPELHFVTERIHLQSQDLLFLYTDGVVETEDKRERQFGLERCAKLLEESRNRPLPWIRDRLVTSLKRFRSRAQFEDDITMMIIRIQK